VYDPGALEAAGEERVDTPWGEVHLQRGRRAGADLFFLARHGAGHGVPPHRVNYRANIWALRELGVERILATYTGDDVLAVGGAPIPDYETARPDWMPQEFDWTFGCVYRGLPESAGPTIRLIGANMSVRADVFDRIGGFHSIDFDDMDMCHRVAALGGPGSVVFNPAAVVHHYVPHERTTWGYFWRRCYHVNRNKVRALQETGVPRSVVPDLRFVLSTATTGFLRELLGAIRGRRGAFRRGAAIVVGVASAGIGSIVGRIDMRRDRGAGGSTVKS
jgi:GT2 family glycosyltransferase